MIMVITPKFNIYHLAPHDSYWETKFSVTSREITFEINGCTFKFWDSKHMIWKCSPFSSLFPLEILGCVPWQSLLFDLTAESQHSPGWPCFPQEDKQHGPLGHGEAAAVTWPPCICRLFLQQSFSRRAKHTLKFSGIPLIAWESEAAQIPFW